MRATSMICHAILQFAIFFVSSFLMGATTSGSSTSTAGFQFLRDSSYDNLKVTNDGDSLVLVALTVTHCVCLCSLHVWCSSVFYTSSGGQCSLHATVFLSPSFASVSLGTRYYRHAVDWCPLQNQLVYNRLAQMCMYFELNPDNKASNWSTADSKCINMGMRLASNLTPLKMDAVLNMTTKNDAINGGVYVGLKRRAPGVSTLEWVDRQALDTAALAPYWEANQPNGACCGQDCVVIRAFIDSTLNDVTCGTLQDFVCELLEP